MISAKEITRTTCKSYKSKKEQLLHTLIENFPGAYKLCNKNIKKFILLLKKGVYPYEYMDSWDKFDETILPNICKILQ